MTASPTPLNSDLNLVILTGIAGAPPCSSEDGRTTEIPLYVRSADRPFLFCVTCDGALGLLVRSFVEAGTPLVVLGHLHKKRFIPPRRHRLDAEPPRPDPPPATITIRATAITTPRVHTEPTKALPVAAAIEPLDRPGSDEARPPDPPEDELPPPPAIWSWLTLHQDPSVEP